ncbi:transposase [Nonomuraea angiospora]|uniref:transposase n=1 Tax=Nonomuraea angiospora TaxID=46172 RepID=UPI0029A80ED7|nr:transposase [Nonomuraea angiospora]MDX3108511.1 transposase [Nonomuraea angiospora]
MDLYARPPSGAVVVCADELGPVVPRAFPPASGWSPDGHRIKAPLDYSRGPEKTWVYGGLRIADGTVVTMTAPSRSSHYYQQFLATIEAANPGDGLVFVITDNLSSHNSYATREWLAGHPRIRQVFIPVGACWLNLQEAWWRIFRRHAIAGQCFVGPDDIDYATRIATAQLNAQAKPWVWGRPPPPPRQLRRRFTYTL